MNLNLTKMKLAFATLALALVAFIAMPTSSAQASAMRDGLTQSEQQAQPLEMQRRRGYRGHRGYRNRGYGYRGHYRPRRAYGFYAPRPVMCRVVVRYDAWGYPRRMRRCY